jgi:hypothetical protein
MPIPIDTEAAPLTTSPPAHGGLPLRDGKHGNGEPAAIVTQTVPGTPPVPEFHTHSLTHHFPRNLVAPRVGELHLWRFRSEWLPVTVLEGEMWLSRSERERARLHPGVALRKQIVNARMVVRWIVGNLFGCPPADVELHDDGHEKLRAQHPREGHEIVIDIAYGGIWIVVGVAATPLGLSVVAPSPGAPPDHSRDDARDRARDRSLRNGLRDASVKIDTALLCGDTTLNAFELGEHGAWHLLDVPMAGKIRAAVALAGSLERVHAFGWPKGLAFGQ